MKPERSLTILAAAIGLLWGVFIAWVGIHTTGDSVVYMNTALSVTQDGTLADNPIWPPLYPLLLGLVTLAVDLPTDAAAVLSALSMALLLACTGHIVRWATGSLTLAATTMLFLCSWWELLYVFRVAWSEQLFAALVALHLLMLIRHWEHGRTADFLLAALSVSLVALCRYIGYSLVLVFVVYAAVVIHRRRQWRLIPVLAAGLAPVGLWLLRNLVYAGSLHGERPPTDLTAAENLALAAEVLGAQVWSVPMLPALLLTALAAGGAVLWWGRGPQRGVLGYVAAWVVLYAGLLVYATSTVQMDRINPRFLSPILPSLVALIALAFGGIVARSADLRGALYGLSTAALLAGMLGGSGPWLSGMSGLVAAVNTDAVHGQAGFSASRTAEELNALLAEKLKARERLSVLLLTTPSNGLKARLLMLRRPVLVGNGLSEPRIESVDQRTMTLSLELEGSPREILAFSPLRLTTTSGLRRALRQAREAGGTHELLVVTRGRALSDAGMELTALEPGCLAEAAPAPYQAFTCAAASARR